MKLLYTTMEIPIPKKKNLEDAANCIKKFLVHLKGKLARRQICVLKTDGLVFDPIAQERGLFNGGLKCPT